ncbi:MAG: exodeoxyribonuclease III [Rickettsiales bacterium]|nr:exodeoxyribonuclease III [Rickettsiales bacterium]
MKIISWNINSLRLRLPLLRKLVEEANPDVISLQETKVQDADFPLLEVKALGYNFVEFSGEKSYNGVAIISKFPLLDVNKIDILDYGHKRHISAKIKDVELHNFYVPAGGDIPDVKLNDKFDHKLKFVDWMSEYFKSQKNKKIIISGDFNIAPLEHDVWSHKQLLKIVSHTPIEVERMSYLQQSLNFLDTHRHFVDESQKLYSWWSYRARDPLGADKGRRLDHIWVTPNLKDNLKSMNIYKNFRSLNQPSDHVPIETVFKF